jgi:hypothetical protein
MAFDFHPFLCDSDERAMIAERLDGLEADAVYEICADTAEPLNTRFFGALSLPPEDRTKLIDCLVLDSSDVLWTALHTLIPPTDSPNLRAILRQYWNESADDFRVAALHMLARFGDESVLALNLTASRGVNLCWRRWLPDGSRPFVTKFQVAWMILVIRAVQVA